MDELDLMKARQRRKALRKITLEEAARHRRRVNECLEKWYWGEMGQTPDPTTRRPAP